MVDKKISALTALSTPDTTDLLAIVDTSAVETKKITFPNFEAGISHLNIQNIGTNTHAQIDTALTTVGKLQLINHQAVSAVHKVSFVGLSGYKYYLLCFEGSASAGPDNILLQLNGDTGNNYGYTDVTTTTWAATNTVSGAKIAGGNIALVFGGSVLISATPRGSNYHSIIGPVSASTDSNKMLSAVWINAATLSGALMINDAAGGGGNITGNFTMYGVKET